MEIEFITEKLNDKKYVETIDEQIDIRTRHELSEITTLFVAVHTVTAKTVKRYFANKKNSCFRMVSQVFGLKSLKIIGGIWRGLYTRMEDNS